MKAKRLKEKFMNNPDEFYEALTFGDLKIGDKYISLPVPGDNHGHGGFKGAHYIHEKIKSVKAKIIPSLPNNSICLENRIFSHMPDGLLIIKVE
jgi:hypothetical protein